MHIKPFILTSFSYPSSFCDFFSLEMRLALLSVGVVLHQWLFAVVSVLLLLFVARVGRYLRQQTQLNP